MAVLVASSACMLPASKPSTMKLNDENSNASVDMATADLGYLLSYNKIATSITLFNEIPVVQLVLMFTLMVNCPEWHGPKARPLGCISYALTAPSTCLFRASSCDRRLLW